MYLLVLFIFVLLVLMIYQRFTIKGLITEVEQARNNLKECTRELKSERFKAGEANKEAKSLKNALAVCQIVYYCRMHGTTRKLNLNEQSGGKICRNVVMFEKPKDFSPYSGGAFNCPIAGIYFDEAKDLGEDGKGVEPITQGRHPGLMAITPVTFNTVELEKIADPRKVIDYLTKKR